MDDYVSKPVNVPALEAALLRWVHPMPQAPVTSSLFDAIVEAFSRGAPGSRLAMREAVDVNASGDLRVAAHELKGASSNIGALRVAALCQELEAGSHAVDAQHTAELLDQLEVEVHLATQVLSQVLIGD